MLLYVAALSPSFAKALAVGLVSIVFYGCGSSEAITRPKVEFTEIPPAGPGGAARTEPIAGRVIGAKPGQRIVVFAKSGDWWPQPTLNNPFTPIRPDGTWSTSTHLGLEYAAMLVRSGVQEPQDDRSPARHRGNRNYGGYGAGQEL